MAYQTYHADQPVPDAVVVKLYTSGDEVRGFVRKITDPAVDDTLFPGEEMKPEDALKMAQRHSVGEAPIFIELAEGVNWNPAWGELTP